MLTNLPLIAPSSFTPILSGLGAWKAHVPAVCSESRELFLINEISSLTVSYMYVAHSDDSHQSLLLSPYNLCQLAFSLSYIHVSFLCYPLSFTGLSV